LKLVQFQKRSDLYGASFLGVLTDENNVCELPFEGSMRDLIVRCADAEWLAQIEKTVSQKGSTYALSEIRLKAPLSNPEKMIFVGLNYYDHAKESNMAVPKVPILFPKYNNSIVGPDDDVIIPQEVTQCDYEVELAFVIGKTASHVPLESAMDHVFGYTIINDVSARDIQLHEGQWTRGKAIDTFAPMGPCIVTQDEIPDPQQLRLSLKLNSETMQDSNTRELIFDIPYLVSFLSQTIRLSPGDIISTGTPPGVGMGKNPQMWLKDGDVTEAYVEGIGTLKNHYKQENMTYALRGKTW
jgi:2-keto-4-pentenoate hydratase/2-oxohepta-3-ene-1,7-dioic acid hydratase in catechol pathway